VTSPTPRLDDLQTGADEAVASALLLPYQQKWLADPSRVKVYEKSRRIGITWATAAHCVLEAARGKQDVWYVAYAEDAGKEFIRDCTEWAERLHQPCSAAMVDLVEYDEQGRAITVRALGLTFPGSSKRVTALTSNPRSLRGKQGLVVIDEAAHCADLGELLKAAFALLMWGGETWILSTHYGEQNPFAQLCDDIRDGKKPYTLHRCVITDALADGLYKRICATTRRQWSEDGERAWLEQLERDYGEDAREELYCEPSGAGQLYLSRTLIKECMYDAPVLRFEQGDAFMELSEADRKRAVAEWLEAAVLPLLDGLKRDKDLRAFSFGLDFGRTTDLTVLAPMGLRQNLVRRVPFMVELRNVPFNQQTQVVLYVASRLPNFFFGCLDAGGNGSYVSEQAWIHLGGDSYIDRVMLNLAYYRDHMPSLKRVFEDKTIQIPRDVDVAADLSLIRRVNGIPKLPDVRVDGVNSSGRRHGDAAIALFLANVACSKAEEIFTRWEGLTSID
jgi:phage FluMu gp28-like protein